jgi:hypothetical protein
VAVPVAATASSGVVLAALPDATNAVVGLLVVALLAGELAQRGRHGRSALHMPLLGTIAFAVTAFSLGHSGAPLCDPDGLVQPHAVWHVAMAIASAWWTARTFAVEPVPSRAAADPAAVLSGSGSR